MTSPGVSPYRVGVAREDRRDEGVGRAEPGRPGAEGDELAGELAVAVDERDLDRRVTPRAAFLGEGAHDVHAVLGEQGDAAALVVGDRPGEQAAQHLGG